MTPAAAQPRRIPPDALVAASRDPIASALADGAALFHPGTGVYFGLNAVGAHVWAQLAQPVRVAALLDAVTSQYDVSRERAERDLLALLHQMAKARLVKICPPGAATP